MNFNWEKELLGELGVIKKGKISEQSDYPKSGFIPIINTDVLRGDIKVWGEILGSVTCNRNEVLILWDGERSGLCAIGYEGIVGSTFAKITVNEKLFPEYLFRFLDWKFPWIQNQRTGTGVPHVPKNLGSILYVNYPPKYIQSRISDILSNCDLIIEKTEASIAKYEAIKKGMMQDLITRGIDLKTGKLRPKYEDAPELYKKSELGMIPNEWDDDELKNLTHSINDGTHFTPTYTDSGVPFLRVTDVQSEHINFDKLKFISDEEHQFLIKRCKPEKGDILYSKNGTIGIPKVVNWDWEFSIFVSLALIKPNHSKINSNYLSLLLPEEVIWKQIRVRSKQGTVTNLHLEEIREFVIPLPSPEEQKAIYEKASSIIMKINSEKKYLEKYKKIKSGLMQDLLSGKVEVTIDKEELANQN